MPLLIRFSKNPEHGSVGCTIGLAPWATVGASGTDGADALHKAADMATALQSVINANPALAAGLSILPGGFMGLQALSLASKVLKNGGTVDDVHQQVGPNAANVVATILKGILG